MFYSKLLLKIANLLIFLCKYLKQLHKKLLKANISHNIYIMELNHADKFAVDQTIIAFYNENPNLNFITMNHIFIDILKKLSTNLNETITNNINHKILATLTDLSKDIVGIKQDVATKLNDTKKEYIDNIKLIIENNSMSSNDKLQHILEKNNETIAFRTSSIIQEIVPKQNDKFVDQLETSIKSLYESLNNDTNKLLENINKDDKSITEFVSSIDTKFNNIIVSMQQPLFNCIQSSEERTSNNVQQIRDKLISQQLSQDNLNQSIHEFLNKYKHNSSSKGNVSEYELYSILQVIFPSDEIIDCSTETSTCDYRVNRKISNKPTILFENKDYSKTVTTEEVNKFKKDLKLQQLHGIFISQKSNITFKDPFQIDIIDNLIHIYLPNAEYNVEKIRIAVEIIDALSYQLKHNANAKKEITTINIEQEDVDELIELFNNFNMQKENIIDTIKTTNKQILDKIDNLQLISVKNLLTKLGFIQVEEDFKCKYGCNYIGKNKASLGAHYRNCKSNPSTQVKLK